MKKIFKVPFMKPFGVVYHNIKAENKDIVLNNKTNLQEKFKGDGVMCIDKNRYQYMWYDSEDFEIEI